jgi:hypothetical protein
MEEGMNARIKKKVRKTAFMRGGNSRLKFIISSRSLKSVHVVGAESLMKQIFHLHQQFPLDESLVELRKWMTMNQKTLYEVFKGGP